MYKIIFAIFFAPLISCSDPKGEKGNEKPSIADQIKITNAKSVRDHFFQSALLLKLDSLQEQSDREEIRIWTEFGITDSANLLRLFKDGNQWQFSAYAYVNKFDQNGVIFNVSKTKLEGHNPKSGRSSMEAKVDSLTIFRFQNYREIPDYQLDTGGDTYAIEILKNGEYRIFCYPSAQSQIGSAKQQVFYLQNFIRYAKLELF